MSAPIAVGARLVRPVYSSPHQFQIHRWWRCLWVCGRRRAFPRFPSWLGKRGSAAGRQRRSSTHPQAFLINLPRCAIAEALVRALVIVETEPGANTGLGFGHCQISVKVDLLVFEAAPQPLDKDVVHAPAVAVHADHDPVPFQGAGKVVAGELAALIGIEDLGEP